MQRLAILLFVLLLLPGSPLMGAEKKPGGARAVVVETALVEKRPVSLALERPGTLKYRRILRIYNQEEGRIDQFPWFEGDRVKQGELLLELDTRKLRSEIRKAEAELKLNKRRVVRLEKLMKQNAASDDEVAEARTELEVARAELELLHTRLGYTRVIAPFSGIVTQRLAEPGDVKARYDHLLTLADPDSLIVRFRADGTVLDQIAVGDRVDIRLNGRDHPATLQRIFPTVDPVSRLGKVEAAFTTLPREAREGEYARVRLTTHPRERLLIPFRALRRDRKGEHVYLVKAGQAVRQTVKSGLRIGDEIEILEGLEPDQEVIARGFLGLRNGTSITVSSHPKPDNDG
ncbi:MAG: efflux RND transporter periplasmic adaptor subunit [Gammaproteobacteria bacterium]|nr:MAG: efflux RND transporter periplasmic adaptor subunit [Gammaproteobacteria bacterium]